MKQSWTTKGQLAAVAHAGRVKHFGSEAALKKHDAGIVLSQVTRRLKGEQLRVDMQSARGQFANWYGAFIDEAMFEAMRAPRNAGKALPINRPRLTNLTGKRAHTLVLDDIEAALTERLRADDRKFYAAAAAAKRDDDQVDALRYAASAPAPQLAPEPPTDKEILAKVTARLKMPVKRSMDGMDAAAQVWAKNLFAAAARPSFYSTLLGVKVARPADFGVIQVSATA